MATTHDPDPRDLAADLAHCRAELEAAQAQRAELVEDLEQIHGVRAAADPVRELVEHLQRYGAEFERELVDVKTAAKGEVDRLTTLLGRAAEERDAARAAGLADAERIVAEATASRDRALELVARETLRLQEARAELTRAASRAEELKRERDEALARRGQPVEADAHEELGALKMQIAELRAAMDATAPGPLQPVRVIAEAVEAMQEITALEGRVYELESEENTPEHTLGAALLEWLSGDSTFDELRDLINACADGPTIDDDSVNVDEPGLAPGELARRRCWVLLSEVVKDGAWAEREEAARRIAELETDADAELRRIAEAQREALDGIAEQVEGAFASTDGENPRPSAAMRDHWRNAMQRIRHKVEQSRPTSPAVGRLRVRDRAVAALLEQVRKLAEASDYEGEDDEELERREHARGHLCALLGDEWDERDGPLDTLLGTRRNGPTVWGEEPAPTEEDAAIAGWALESYKGDASFMVHGTPRLTGLAGALWEGLRAHFVAQPFLLEIGASLARLRGDVSVSVESQHHARELYGIRFLRDMYAAHDDGAQPFGAVGAAVDAWVLDHAPPYMTRGTGPANDAGPADRHPSAEEALRVIARTVDRPELGEDGVAPRAIVAAVQTMRARLWGDLLAHVDALREVADALGEPALAAALDDPDRSARAAVEVAGAARRTIEAGGVLRGEDARRAVEQLAGGCKPDEARRRVEAAGHALGELERPAGPEAVVGAFEYRGQGVDLLKRGRQVLWRVRGVTPDSGGAPVELGRAVAPLARKEAEAAARRWISEYLERHPDRAPPE